jgi:hypothetical protein
LILAHRVHLIAASSDREPRGVVARVGASARWDGPIPQDFPWSRSGRGGKGGGGRGRHPANALRRESRGPVRSVPT